MLTGELRSKADSDQDASCSDGIANPSNLIEQIT